MDYSKTAIFGSRKRITDPEAIRIARELENDPNVPSAKELMYAFYQAIGMDVDYDSIFADQGVSIMNISPAEYSSRKKPTSEEHRKIRERIEDPYTLTCIDKLRAFYEWRNLEFDEDIFENIIRKNSPE